jgi:hypothetical protein
VYLLGVVCWQGEHWWHQSTQHAAARHSSTADARSGFANCSARVAESCCTSPVHECAHTHSSGAAVDRHWHSHLASMQCTHQHAWQCQGHPQAQLLVAGVPTAVVEAKATSGSMQASMHAPAGVVEQCEGPPQAQLAADWCATAQGGWQVLKALTIAVEHCSSKTAAAAAAAAAAA